jgi:diaminohydroxyphosphoribosylaminopyrimidine deaminase/5-amino-6-(5-phosphoribosylamino)uracil reductase
MAKPDVSDQLWMSRCFDLARKGIGHVSPNPPVGAVLLYQNTIMAEGYHHYFGGPHAEVETIGNVPADKKHLVKDSILYVSLEPCCITGKTPPCTELIIKSGIKEVRVSAIDPNPDVAGKGIAQLQKNGINVVAGILKEEGEQLIRSFRMNILHQRPYVILKWAQSKHLVSGVPDQQIWFSHPHTLTFSHCLRAECEGIIVGAKTVETDNPSLTTRDYPGRSPARIIYDPNGKLHSDYKVFLDDGLRIFYFSSIDNPALSSVKNIITSILEPGLAHVPQILSTLFKNRIGSLLVEGGSYVHQLFIKENLWDEAWVIKTQNETKEGIQAPNIKGKLIDTISIGADTIVGIANDQQH